MASDGITVDASDLKRLSRNFKKVIAKDASKELRDELKTIGKKVKVTALGRYREVISPAAISVRTSGSVSGRAKVTLAVVSNEAAPHRGKALAFENGGNIGTFRHPVFGNRNVWVSQEADPWLTLTAEEMLPEITAQIGAAVDRAFRRSGFS